MNNELVGFVLLNKIGTLPDTEWNMGEFFIVAKFQGKGIASQVVNQIWKSYPGKWEVSVIPENTRALSFWRKEIGLGSNQGSSFWMIPLNIRSKTNQISC